VRGVGLCMARVRMALGTSYGDLYSGKWDIYLFTSVLWIVLGFDGIGEVKSIDLVTTEAGFWGNTSLSTFAFDCSTWTTTFCVNKSNSCFFTGSTTTFLNNSISSFLCFSDTTLLVIASTGLSGIVVWLMLRVSGIVAWLMLRVSGIVAWLMLRVSGIVAWLMLCTNSTNFVGVSNF